MRRGRKVLMLTLLCVASVSGIQAGVVTVFLDNGNNAPGTSNTAVPFPADGREATWDVSVTAENGLAEIGATVMSVRMVTFNQNANSRTMDVGFGRGLGITTATNPSWMDAGQAAGFELSFYSDAAKTVEITGLKITLDSLLVQSESDDLALDVYAGAGGLALSLADNAGFVSIGGTTVVDGRAGDVELSFVGEAGLAATGTGANDAYYTISSGGSVVFSENDVVWMRRRNLNDASNKVYRLGGVAFDVVRSSGYAGWAGGWGGIDIGADINDYDGDGVINLHEYGLGGDPTNSLDQGISPEFEVMDVGGTNRFGYVYPQLAAGQDSGLAYFLELNTDLVGGTWTSTGYDVTGTNITGVALDFVSATTDMVEQKKFVRLNISRNKTLFVDDFGAVGDGVQDDIGAVVDALVALRAVGSGGILEFTDGKTYKLGLRSDSIFQIDLQGLTNVTVNGNGAMLLNTPEQATIRVERCKGVTVQNFVIEQSPLAYSQGTITYIHPDGDYFEMETLPGFPLSIEAQNAALSNHWDWGSIIDPDLKRIRPDMTTYFFVSDIINPVGQVYQVYMDGQAFKNQLKNNGRIGDIWFQPLQFNSGARLLQIGALRYDPNIHVTLSSDILIENITLYSGRSSMCNKVDFNYGLITYRGFRLEIPPWEPERVVSNWRGGFNCQNNRVGPVIEDCYFASQLDDSINFNQVGTFAAVIVPGTTNRTFQMASAGWTTETGQSWMGDDVMAFHPATGEYIGPVKVVGVDPAGPGILLTFDAPVSNVVVEGEANTTHFYNMNMINAGFVVRDNIFMPQRRHAVLSRAFGGVIENNTINGVGGNGIILGNELNIPEGPFPRNTIIRGNYIEGTYRTPIVVESDTGVNNTHLTRDIVVTNNVIKALVEPAVRIQNAQDILIQNNGYYDTNDVPLSSPVLVEDSINVVYP